MVITIPLVGLSKMAAEEKQRVNDALKALVSITEKSGNLHKDLKNNIHVSVSTLRKIFSHLMNELENVKDEYKRYRYEVKKTTKEEVTGGVSLKTRQVAPSMEHIQQSEHRSAAVSAIRRRKKETFL